MQPYAIIDLLRNLRKFGIRMVNKLMNEIMVIGSISTDFNVNTAVLPAIGETVSGDSFSISFGGKGANQAIAAARLGAQVHMVGTVGNDIFAEKLINNLTENGIDATCVAVNSEIESGSAHITKYQNDNAIIYIAAANDTISTERIIALTPKIKEMAYVVIQNEIPMDVVTQIIEICHAEGVKVIYNPAPAKAISPAVIDKVDLFTPNETEFKSIFPELSVEEGLKKYPLKMIVTLGSEGVVYYDGDRIVTIPSYKVNVVDTTGAGDTFNGALAYALSKGIQLEDSARFANLAAALSIQEYGAQEGMPTAQAIQESEHFDKEWLVY